MDLVHVPDIRGTDEELLERWWRFNCAIELEERPDDEPMSLPRFAAWFRNVEPTTTVSSTLAVDDDSDEVIAEASAWINTNGENPHLLRSQLTVRPDHRKRGLGTRLLRRLVEQADEHDRTLMTTWTSSTVPAGEAFAAKLGADPVLRSHTNRLLVEKADREAIARWVREGPTRASDYELEWIDVAALETEDEYQELVDCLDLILTMPTEDLDAENERHTPEWITSRLARHAADGTEWWFLAARHRQTQTRVGFTDTTWNPDKPYVVYQGGTAVDIPHRGHALGKWLKSAMFERITTERPQVTEIRTGNADSNAAMLGINHAMGFEPWVSHTTWQITVERVREFLDPAGSKAT